MNDDEFVNARFRELAQLRAKNANLRAVVAAARIICDVFDEKHQTIEPVKRLMAALAALDKNDGPQVGAEVSKVTSEAGNLERVGSIPPGSESGSSILWHDHEAAPMGARVKWGDKVMIKGRCGDCLACDRLGYCLAPETAKAKGE